MQTANFVLSFDKNKIINGQILYLSDVFQAWKCRKNTIFSMIEACRLLRFNDFPRASGGKRRSGDKPGARVTNFALAKSKVHQ